MHETIHRQVVPSEGVDNIQCHHNSHQRIRGFLQEQVVKYSSIEYRLCRDDTQAPTMAYDRLFHVTRAAIELQKSNPDQPPSSLYGNCCHGPLWPWSTKICLMDGWQVYGRASRHIQPWLLFKAMFWPMITHTWSRSSLAVIQSSLTLRSPSATKLRWLNVEIW